MNNRLIIFLLMLMCGVNSALAGDLVIVTSSDAEPYRQAEASLRDKLASQKKDIRTIPLAKVLEAGDDARAIQQAEAVVAIGTGAAVELSKSLSSPIPLVYCMVADPASVGLTRDRRTWGVCTDVPADARIRLIAEALPGARSLGVLYRKDAPESVRQLEETTRTLPQGWKIESVGIASGASVADAIEELMKRRPDVIWTAPDPALYDNAAIRALLLSALRTRTPVFGFSPAFVRAGALLGTGVDPRAQGSQAGDILLEAIKKPQKPGNDTKDQNRSPEQYQIAVNLIVAEKLELNIPDNLKNKAQYLFKGEGR